MKATSTQKLASLVYLQCDTTLIAAIWHLHRLAKQASSENFSISFGRFCLDFSSFPLCVFHMTPILHPDQPNFGFLTPKL